jgi:hypothetical protein
MRTRIWGKRFSYFGLLTFAASAYFAPIDEAKASTVRCDNCTSDQVEEQVWWQLEQLPAAAQDIVYVVNVPAGSVRKFRIAKTYENGGDPRTCSQPMDEVPLECIVFPSTEELAPEDAIVTYMAFMQVHAASATPEEIWLNPADNFPDNAYEAVQYPVLSENVGTYLKSGGWGYVNDLIYLESVVNLIPGFNPENIKLTLRVNYAEGGSGLYVYNHVTKTFERVKGENRDTSGNKVPETPADVSGGAGSSVEYEFENDTESLSEFIMRMDMLGVPITGPMSDTLVCTGYVKDGAVYVTCKFL